MEPSQPPVILLVEDNSDDVLIFERALRKAHITCPLITLNNGQEAIDFLAGEGPYSNRQLYPLPSLIFLDLKMPIKTGFDVLEWLNRQGKGSRRSIPAAVLSSSSEPRDMDRAISLGARAYLVKPPTAAMLVEIFESTVSKIAVCASSNVVTDSSSVKIG